MRNFFQLPRALFLVIFLFTPLLHGVHEQMWRPVDSSLPDGYDLTKVTFGAEIFVAIGVNGRASRDAIIRSEDGFHWEAVDLPEGVRLTDVAFGAGAFVAVGTMPEGELNVAAAYFSEDGREWVLAGALPASGYRPTGVGYVKDRFWMVSESKAFVYWSKDGRGWMAGQSGPVSGVPVAVDHGILAYIGGGIWRGIWSDQSGNLEAQAGLLQDEGAEWNAGGRYHWISQGFLGSDIVGIAAGADRVVALTNVSKPEYKDSVAVSEDGSLWMNFEREPERMHTIANLRGRFWAIGEGREASLLSSRDGARWANRREGIGLASLRSITAGKGMLVVVGDHGVIFNRSVHLAPAIVSQPPEVLTLAEGHPLLLAVEVEAGEDPLIHWFRDGHPIPGAHDLALRIPAVRPDDAGNYSMTIANDAGSVTSHATEVRIAPASSEPIPWETVMTSPEVNFSRVAGGGGRVMVVGHHGEFYPSLASQDSAPFPAAWSEKGYNWRGATFLGSGKERWLAAGFVKRRFWMGGQEGELAFSEDGIAWRRISLGTYPITLVGEHQGKLIALSGNSVWASEDGEEWNLLAQFPVAFAGGYHSDGDRLWVASIAGTWWWDGASPQRVKRPPQGYQPRLVRSGEVFLHLARDNRAHPLQRSGDGETWTQLLGTLRGSRDLIAHDRNFLAVGPEMFRTSNDGVWWANRTHSLGGAFLNGCAVEGDMLYAVGDGGKILKRPATLEPAFYQHPRSMDALRGQPMRLTARATGSELISYQWYRGDHAIEGATDPVLEIEEVSMEHAGEYTVVARNGIGSVRSTVANITVELRSPVKEPWRLIGEIPSLPDFATDPSSVVTGGGTILAAADDRTISLSRDGQRWVRTRVALGDFDFANRVSYAGGIFFAAGAENMAMSADGVAWERLVYPANVNSVAYGNGVYVFGGLFLTYWSSDLREIGGSADIGGFSRVVFAHDRFVAVTVQGLIYHSFDGKQWVLDSLPPRDRIEQSLFEEGERYELTYGNGHSLLLVAPYLYRSEDAKLWEGPWETDPVYQLIFQGGDFWRSSSVGEDYRLFASNDSRRWVSRQANLPGESAPWIARADDFDIIALVGRQVYRRSALLEPVFYPSPSDYVVYPGSDLVIPAPEYHGDPADYRWFKDGSFFGTGLNQEIEGAEAVDGGVYRVTANNSSGQNAVEFMVHYVGGYDDWAGVYHQGGESRVAGDDPGGFGIPNLLRYALHLDPESPDHSRLPRLDLVTHNGKEFATLNFQLLEGVDDYEWYLEASSDLVEWTNLQWGYVENSQATGSVREIVTRDTAPLEDTGRRFLRLRIDRMAAAGIE